MEETDVSGSETTRKLGAYLADVSYRDLPADVRERERWHVLDSLGCLLYGTTTPWVRKVFRGLDAAGESGSVPVPGTDRAYSPARAALVGGTATHAMDYDDHCQEAGVHAGSAAVPCGLAYAAHADRSVSGREFLTAVTAGVEVGIRGGYGIGFDSVRQGWHIAGWTGALTGAATTGVLMDLDEEELAHALAIAGTQGCGLLGAQFGAEVKRFHMGKAAEAGYLAAALAGEGFTGDVGLFADRYGGIGHTMSEEYDIPAVTDGLGERYELLRKLSFKPFPSVGMVHASVDATLDACEAAGVDPRDVDSVTVAVTEASKEHVGWPYEPIDVMAAQSNIGYAIAALLTDGELGVAAYTPEAIEREAVVERVADVDIVVDETLDSDDPDSFGARVEVVAGGERSEGSVETPRGYPENPMTEDELREKFDEQATAVLSAGAADELADAVLDVEAADDVTALIP